MADKSPEEKWAEFLRKNPNASDKKISNYLSGHGRVAYWLGQQTAPAPANSPTPATADPALNMRSPSNAAPETPLPDPAASQPAVTADPTAWQKGLSWIEAHSLILAPAALLLVWLLFRKKRS
jgi:hypothetical protein